MDGVKSTGTRPTLPGTPTSRAVTMQVMRQLRQDGARVAKQFGLPTPRLQAERAGVNGHYGICYRDGRIRIRLRHARTGRLLKYSGLINTLCHELAHLRHFDHGEHFKQYYFRLLRWARWQSIYVPATATPRVARRAAHRANQVVSPAPVHTPPDRPSVPHSTPEPANDRQLALFIHDLSR